MTTTYFKNFVSVASIAELLYVECLKQGVEINENEKDVLNKLNNSADYIASHVNTQDITDVTEYIINYVKETKEHYPNYFSQEGW